MKSYTTRCTAHGDECLLTAGYYLGGGQWICWLGAVISPATSAVISKTGQQMVALPKEEAHDNTAHSLSTPHPR